MSTCERKPLQQGPSLHQAPRLVHGKRAGRTADEVDDQKRDDDDVMTFEGLSEHEEELLVAGC